MARDERHLTVPIVPVGLTFERKWEPRSRVLMHMGQPVELTADVPNDSASVSRVTQQVDTGLRGVTLNFTSDRDAKRILSISTLLAEILDEFRPLHAPDPPLAESLRVAHRINAISPRLAAADAGLTTRIEQFLTRVSAFEQLTRNNAILPSDVQMSTGLGAGAWFVVRETLIAALAGPLAVWGRINHWLPLRIARLLARRTSRAPDEPAMHTIVAGLILVLIFYAGQIALVGWALGWIAASLYGLSLPASATWDFRYSDRVRRAVSRVRTYLRLRRNSELQKRLMDDLGWLRAEAVALDAAIDLVPAAAAQAKLA
jgi:hypothetical protein